MRAAEHSHYDTNRWARSQVFIKFVEIQYAHDILQTTQGTDEYKHTSGEVSIVRIEMAGRGTKRVSIANLPPPEIHKCTLRTHLASYGENRTVDFSVEGEEMVKCLPLHSSKWHTHRKHHS